VVKESRKKRMTASVFFILISFYYKKRKRKRNPRGFLHNLTYFELRNSFSPNISSQHSIIVKGTHGALYYEFFD
jgi:hypothetical protein